MCEFACVCVCVLRLANTNIEKAFNKHSERERAIREASERALAKFWSFCNANIKYTQRIQLLLLVLIGSLPLERARSCFLSLSLSFARSLPLGFCSLS